MATVCTPTGASSAFPNQTYNSRNYWVDVVFSPALQSIAVTPADPTILAGATQPFTATGTYSDSSTQDLTSQVTWTSSATAVATISGGSATGVSTGSTTISAALNNVTGSTTLTLQTAPAGSLPSPWKASDIGSVGRAGSASYANGVFTVAGSGADIWNSADGFHYVHQPLPGDGTIMARLASITTTDPWAKAGVMIRESLKANARHAMVVVTPGNGITFQRRTATGGDTAYTAGAAVATPYWVKLVRSGSTFTAYQSANGSTWTQIGSAVTISMATNAYASLALTSHNNGVLNTATLDNW